jgi:hypothetical protein
MTNKGTQNDNTNENPDDHPCDSSENNSGENPDGTQITCQMTIANRKTPDYNPDDNTI